MKKTTKSDVAGTLAVIIPIAAVIFLMIFISGKCLNTNSPLWIWLDLSFNGVFLTALCMTAIGVCFAAESIRTCLSDLRNAVRTSVGKLIAGFILVLLLFSHLLYYPDGTRYVKINGKHPFRLQYNCDLLLDAIMEETETVTVNAADFRLESHRYSTGNGRSRSQRQTVYYAGFLNNSVYLYRNTLQSYLAACQQEQKEMTVVYYKNSRIIQSIDGISLYNESEFNHAANRMSLAYEQKQEEQQAAEKAAQEEAEQKRLALFSAFYHSEGKNYEEIVRQLKKQGIENTYKTIYISTNYYEVGTVALFDNPQEVIYVVRDNDAEDMVEIPPLPMNGTFAEITKILDDAGILWTFHCMGSYTEEDINRDHSKDILNTVHCLPGTPIPQDYVFWFSVHHVG